MKYTPRMKNQKFWQRSVLKKSLDLLDKNEKRKILFVVLIQVGMAALDLIAIALVGVLGSLAVTGVSSQDPASRVNQVLHLLHLNSQSFQFQVAVLGITAAVLLITRTVLSIFFTKRILYFLSRRAASISESLLSKLLNQPLLFVQSRTSQQTLYSLTHGVSSITVGVIGTTISLIADISLLTVLSAGLFIVNPYISFAMILIFGLFGFSLYKLLNQRANTLGSAAAVLEIESNEKIIEVLSSYRESIVRNRRAYYSHQIATLRYELANTQAELAFMPNISKYIIESTVVLGSLLIAGIQFVLQDATHAVATLSIFLVAGMRIAPAALRLQQGAIQLKMTTGSAATTLDLVSSLGNLERIPAYRDSEKLQTNHPGFIPEVFINNAQVTYPGKNKPAITEIDFLIKEGESIAIVGSSGAGKTTLVDTILGVLIPDKGSVLISGLTPKEAVSKWPGAVAYVPQDVSISNGTIRENVALGYPADSADDSRIIEALGMARLLDFVSTLEKGVDTPVGEKGAKLSGGQRQRLGIARALFTSPKLLVLDEATSALDGQTEMEIAKAIDNLKGSVTLIVIAHRLSTIRNSDKVIFMNNSRIEAVGNFEEVRSMVPNFDVQAKLMGL
jgi:ABC-type multidrug transport system fused ATPase/permease subunit